MSGAQTSTFTNNLYDPLMASRQTSAENQLLIQQQDIGGHELEMGARLAGTLLSSYDTPEARAAAYPGLVANARAQFPGYFKNAPSVYPGDEATRALARMGTPSKDLFALGVNQQAKQNLLPTDGTATATPAAQGGPSSGTIEPDALTRAQAVRDGLIKRGLDVDTATGFAANALHESGANPNVGAGDAGASHGAFQWNADRYNRYIAINGHPPDNAPLDEQLDFVIHELGTTEGAARDRIAAAQGPAGKAAAISQFYLRPKDVQPEIARRSATASQLVSQWGSAGSSSVAPVITGDSLASPAGLGGTGVKNLSSAAVLANVRADSRAGKYDGKPVVLSTGASNDFGSDLGSVEQQLREAQAGNAGRITVLGVGPAVEAKAPGTNAKLAALSKAYGADFVPLPADQMSPDGVHPTAQGYATLKATIAPSQGGPGGGGAGGRYQIAGPPVAGPGAGSGGAPGGDLVGPRVLPPIGPGSPVVTPQSLANTPPAAAAPAQPSAPAADADLPPMPQPPVAPKVKGSGYTDAQERALRQAANDPTVSPDEFRKQQNSFLAINQAANEKAYSDSVEYARLAQERASLLERRAKNAAEEQRALEAAKLAAEAAQRAVEAAGRAKEQHELTMQTQGLPAGQQRDASGVAKPIPGYREAPPPGYRYNAQGQQEIVPGGPADPAVVKAQADARLEPPPGYRRQQDGSLQIIPGGPADPDVLKAQAEAKGAGGRNMPPTERDKLIKSAGQIDEMGILRNNFQDYGGYWTGSIGDMVNYIARNTPNDSPRAEWWQEYQRQKLAARQVISGQSLTSSEQAQYEKADINPGMSNETIRRNLQLQHDILTRARDRTVLSMVKDGYNPGAVEEAAAVRLQDAQSRMSKDVVEQGTRGKPLANTTIKVDRNGRIIQ